MTQQNQNKKLKDRQKEIVDYILRYRYISRPQIQTLLHHKSRDNVLEWLNDLTDKGYLFRFYSKEFAGKPSEYCLDKGSILYLRENGVSERILKRIYTEKTNSQTFREHCKLILTIFLSLEELVAKTEAALSFNTKDDLHNVKYLPFPHPDCYFAITEKTGRIKRYFLDAFDDSSFMKKRTYQYVNYFKKRYWQKHTTKSFPEIILICKTDKDKKNLCNFIQKKFKTNSPDFYQSTWIGVIKQGMNKQTLEKII